MWNRKDLKQKGKTSFKANYWKCVLAGLILTIALAGGIKITKLIDSNDFVQTDTTSKVDEIVEDIVDDAELQKILEENGITIEAGEHEDHETEHMVSNTIDSVLASTWFRPLAGIVALLALLGSTLGVLLKIFLLNPLQVGGRRFFLKNLDEKAEIKEYGWGFSNSYINMVGTMFFKGLYTFLWSLLFVIPGIVKAYEYRMIPYILAEDSEIDRKEAFARSKEMMTGNKWDAFVLDLSFIGWEILNALTIGLVGLFYSNPYQFSTMAALYQALKVEKTEAIEYDNYVEVE